MPHCASLCASQIVSHRMHRREVLKQSATALAALAAGPLATARLFAGEATPRKMSFGLVTYMVGSEWDLPTLIANCEQTNVLGVELRTTHKHGVEPSLNAAQRGEVRRRFADSNVKLVGVASNENFDSPDSAVVRKAMDTVKEFVKLSHDVGSSGVKVKPNDFHKDVPQEQTIEQIGKSLLELGKFAADYHQEIRLEVHGSCGKLPTIRSIVEVADHPNVTVCWNSNNTDLHGEGLEHNFNLVRDRFGGTCHVHRLDKNYPYAQLMKLLVASNYDGWVLLEEGRPAKDRVGQLVQQRELYDKLLAAASV